ncbi:MAG: DNA polymerase IV [Burkholderiaceae bacterium]
MEIPRRIAHLDMDAFYASVELLRRPDLRGKPVIVGGRGDPSRRGVVTTANYEARRFGVGSAMPLRIAAARCPEAIFLPADFDEYRRLSRLFKAAITRLAPAIEDRGIDEVFIDLTAVAGVEVEHGGLLAREIKHEVYCDTGLTCSIAVAPNKLLAKLGSELDKPDGLTVLLPADLEPRIWPLAASRINGIGPKAAARLAEIGIDTIGQLAARPPAELIAVFGPTYGAWLHAAAHGIDDRPLVLEREPKSLSRETTFEHDLHPIRQRAEIEAVLARLAEKVAADLARRGYGGRTVGLKLRFADFTTLTRDFSLPQATQDSALIHAAVIECLARVSLTRKVRLLGVRVGALASCAELAAEPGLLSLF